MKAVKDEFTNGVLTGGEGVNDLPVCNIAYDDKTPAVVSVWELSDDDLINLNLNRKLYLEFIGHTHPPVLPHTANPIGIKT